MWGLKIQIKNNSYPVEVYRIMINEARHHLDVRLKPKSDYIQIRQGETKTILPGELCRQQIYTFDASIRIYLITPFEEAYEIRYINTDRLNYYQSEPVPILYSKEDHESSKVQTTQVRQYSIHGGIKGTIKGEFYQFNLSSCIRQQNSLTAQFVSFSLANLANIFYPPRFLQ